MTTDGTHRRRPDRCRSWVRGGGVHLPGQDVVQCHQQISVAEGRRPVARAVNRRRGRGVRLNDGESGSLKVHPRGRSPELTCLDAHPPMSTGASLNTGGLGIDIWHGAGPPARSSKRFRSLRVPICRSSYGPALRALGEYRRPGLQRCPTRAAGGHSPGDQGHCSGKTVVCGATSSLGVSVVALDHVSSSIIDHCAVSSEVGGHQPDD